MITFLYFIVTKKAVEAFVSLTRGARELPSFGFGEVSVSLTLAIFFLACENFLFATLYMACFVPSCIVQGKSSSYTLTIIKMSVATAYVQLFFIALTLIGILGSR